MKKNTRKICFIHSSTRCMIIDYRCIQCMVNDYKKLANISLLFLLLLLLFLLLVKAIYPTNSLGTYANGHSWYHSQSKRID